ncbi:hypothetical protein VTL71DRAFT_16299 [Oculimacula yallundae]|uniref:FAD/NAD(P)-binding domain-containing protein n=1 Tax=Oculimacula yallundae TaxID=86028 RepID=A0ABR4CE17_9HELO
MAVETANLVVVGAGIYGLQMAKVYIHLHPTHKIIILDGNKSLGGTWSRDRIYPGLKANNILGWFEYPDMPLTADEFDVKAGDHIKAEAFNAYLETYAERFHVTERLRLNTRVVSIQHAAGAGCTAKSMRKGLLSPPDTSEALLPWFPGQETFQPPLFHTKDWAQHQDILKSAKSAVVLGGGKSAFDAAYMLADAGVKCHMVIRSSGHGPAWMSQYLLTPFKIGLESLVNTRAIGWFSPCVWAHYGGYGLLRRFLHGTWLGRRIVDGFWAILQIDNINLSGLQGHPTTERLMPWSDLFWSGTSCSILNYEKDFYQFVRTGLIEVHVADVEQLAADAVVLSTGERLRVDAVACATSWKVRPAINFLPAGSEAKLGLPHYDSNPDREERFATADAQIFKAFPKLLQQPIVNTHLAKLPTAKEEPFDPTRCNVPYLLYRFMVPPAYLHERSIAFLGVPTCFAQGIMSTANALWITAYFNGQIEVPALEEAVAETALHARHARWRNPAGYGASFPDWIFDTMPFLDMVFGDLGMSSWIKTGFWKDAFTPYYPRDFAGIVELYRRKCMVGSGK